MSAQPSTIGVLSRAAHGWVRPQGAARPAGTTTTPGPRGASPDEVRWMDERRERPPGGAGWVLPDRHIPRTPGVGGLGSTANEGSAAGRGHPETGPLATTFGPLPRR